MRQVDLVVLADVLLGDVGEADAVLQHVAQVCWGASGAGVRPTSCKRRQNLLPGLA